MKKSMFFVVLFVIIVFVWAVWITAAIKGRKGRYKYPGRRGVIYDIEQDPSSFEIVGFEYFAKLPFRSRQHAKTLKADKLWLLKGENKGRIALTGLQARRRKLKDVTLVVKYHIFWEGPARLSAVGTDVTNSEQVTEDLPQGGEGYCIRRVFLGPVHEVYLEAEAKEKKTFVIIDEFKVAVGTKDLDNIEEVVCL